MGKLLHTSLMKFTDYLFLGLTSKSKTHTYYQTANMGLQTLYFTSFYPRFERFFRSMSKVYFRIQKAQTAFAFEIISC